LGHSPIVASRDAVPEQGMSEYEKVMQVFGAPDSMQLIPQLLALSSPFDKVLDLIQLICAARFEPTGVVKDKAMSCRILKLVFDVVFSTLNDYIECVITGGCKPIRYTPKLKDSTQK